MSGALTILIHSSLGWPEQRGWIRLVKLVSPHAARAHNLDYTPQADHCSFTNLAKVFFAVGRDVFAYFPVCAAYGSIKELVKFGESMCITSSM